MLRVSPGTRSTRCRDLHQLLAGIWWKRRGEPHDVATRDRHDAHSGIARGDERLFRNCSPSASTSPYRRSRPATATTAGRRPTMSSEGRRIRLLSQHATAFRGRPSSPHKEAKSAWPSLRDYSAHEWITPPEGRTTSRSPEAMPAQRAARLCAQHGADGNAATEGLGQW